MRIDFDGVLLDSATLPESAELAIKHFGEDVSLLAVSLRLMDHETVTGPEAVAATARVMRAQLAIQGLLMAHADAICARDVTTLVGRFCSVEQAVMAGLEILSWAEGLSGGPHPPVGLAVGCGTLLTSPEGRWYGPVFTQVCRFADVGLAQLLLSGEAGAKFSAAPPVGLGMAEVPPKVASWLGADVLTVADYRT